MDSEVAESIVKLWREMYTFPREYGNPKRKILKSFEEFLDEYRRHNGFRDIFLAVYSFEDQEFKEPIIDRIFLDFDSNDESKLPEVWEEVKLIARKLEEKNIHPLIVFSGRKGFHLYIFFNPVKLSNPKQTVERFISNLFSNTLKYNPIFLDWKIVGDLRRLARVPYSVHPETGRFVIVIDNYNFKLEEILKLSETPYIPKVNITRSETISKAIEFLDSSITLAELEKTEEVIEDIEFSLGNKIEGIVYTTLPCIKAMFQNKLPPGNRRIKAAKYIAIAYYFDHNGDMTGFEDLAKRFADTQNLGHKLRFSEIIGWKRGVYQLNDGLGPSWNCGEIRKYFSEIELPLECYRCDVNKHFLIQKIKIAKEFEMESIKQLRGDDLLKKVKKTLDYYVVGEDSNKLLLFLLLLRNQNIIVKGPPSSGKSTLVESVLKLFPEEDIVTVSGATKKFLRWMERDQIPILYLKEAPKDLLEEVKSEGLAIDVKLAMSDKVLKILMVDPSQKRTLEKKIRVDSIVMTALDIDLPQDVESRVWILAPDISPSQTKRVLEWKAQRKIYPVDEPKDDIERIRKYVKLLKRGFKVVIPYADLIAESLAKISLLPRARRDIDKLFLLIEAIAIARGKIYNLKGEEIVIPDEEDLKLALDLSSSFMEMIMGYDPFTVATYRALKELSQTFSSLTSQIVAENLDIPQTLAEQYLERLVSVGLATKTKEANNYIYKLKELKERKLEINFNLVRERISSFMKTVSASL